MLVIQREEATEMKRENNKEGNVVIVSHLKDHFNLFFFIQG